jgi:lysozyme family protein
MMDLSRSTLSPQYAQLIRSYKIRPSAAVEAKIIANRITRNIDRYRSIEKSTGIPYWFIGGLHIMESGGNFTTHLANGDSIDRPTTNEPKGIPSGTWEECAIAAIAQKRKFTWSGVDWADPNQCLWAAEIWNGWGYRLYHPEYLSPYLWAGTDKYIAGKYISDGRWDPNAVSRQIGLVVIWSALGINLGGKAVDLNEAKLEPALGTLTINQNTWIKTSTAPASSLPDTQKKEAKKNLPIPIFRRLKDLDRHYAIEIEIGQGMGVVYVWRDHANIERSECR